MGEEVIKFSVVIPTLNTVTTSSRRFLQNRIFRQQILNVWYSLQYLVGCSPKRLAIVYERRRGNHTSDTRLGIFVRFPNPGKVKTRLAIELGDELATKFYKSCAEQIFAQTRHLSRDVKQYVFCADGREIHDMNHWAGSSFYYVPQVGADLGQRLEHSFSTLFSHGAEKALIVASDVPDLSSDIIREAILGA